MSFFSSLYPKVHPQTTDGVTTANFFIGGVSAENETNNYPLKLSAVFEDYLDVLSQLDKGKFIILGRKGCGKSAIGEYISMKAEEEANFFCSLIQNTDVNLEKIAQLGENKEGKTIEIEMLYRWIILTQILELITKNEFVMKDQTIFKHIKLFLDRNRGFIDIDKNQMVETIKENGFSINIEYLKRVLRAMGGVTYITKTKESKADFYLLIPDLENLIQQILSQDSDNSYILIFDDLDLGYNCKSKESLNNLLVLLRIVVSYNIHFFAKKQLNTRIIVLLRNDMAKHILGVDSGKILLDSTMELTWYEDIYRNDEKRLLLRRFINRRIAENLKNNNISIIDSNDPWTTLVDETDFYPPKTAFKYIIDNTFYRPRDLILFFKDLDTLKLRIPISHNDIDSILLNRYSADLLTEIKSELSTLYEKESIDIVFDEVLGNFSDRKTKPSFSYTELYNALNESLNNQNLSESIINSLFEYSIIGNLTANNSVYFRFREKHNEYFKMRKNEEFIMHYALQNYYKYHS